MIRGRNKMTRVYASCFRLFPLVCSEGSTFYGCTRHFSQNQSSSVPTCSNHNSLYKTARYFSMSCTRKYEIFQKVRLQEDVSLKNDAVEMFNTAIRAVQPKSMVKNQLKYDEGTSTLRVGDKVYHINKNVYVVGFGKSVMGLARAVDDVLSKHIVTGIISIPYGMTKEMEELKLDDIRLSRDSKIQIYEGAENRDLDEGSYKAALAIHSLVQKLTDKDLLIVLCSEGGSTLSPLPYSPITLEDLNQMYKLLRDNGARITELNIIRKNIEVLKGGKLAKEANSANVLSLILCSLLGDDAHLIASAPTYLTDAAPQHCMEILKRLKILDKTPRSIYKYLDKECKSSNLEEAKSAFDSMLERLKYDEEWQRVQNVVVGSNSIACEAAAAKAIELGYVPLIMSTNWAGESRKVGILFAKLAKFITMCFDRKNAMQPNMELVQVETTLLAEGIKKTWINSLCLNVDSARNSGRDICIIVGGDLSVKVSGKGLGGKNMECVLAAAVQMLEEFKVKDLHTDDSSVCFISCDTDGHDGSTKRAGAVVDQDFLREMANSELDVKKYLDDNDSFTFFNQLNGGMHLVPTTMTGVDVLNIMMLLVQRPKQ